MTVEGNLGLVSARHVLDLMEWLGGHPASTQTEIHRAIVVTDPDSKLHPSKVAVICGKLEKVGWVVRDTGKRYKLTELGAFMLLHGRLVDRGPPETVGRGRGTSPVTRRARRGSGSRH